MGKKLHTPEDAALLAQPYRDPLVEKTVLVYLKDNMVVGHEAWTLNRARYTGTPQVDVVKRHIAATQADSVVKLHNHPSGRTMLSQGDVDSTVWWRDKLGDQFKGHVVINSGKYARMWYNKEGELDIETEVELPRKSRFGMSAYSSAYHPYGVDWDPSNLPEGQTIHPNDPLYKGTMTPEAQQFAAGLPWGGDISRANEHGFRQRQFHMDESEYMDQKIRFARWMNNKSPSDTTLGGQPGGQPVEYYLNQFTHFASDFAEWSASEAIVAFGAHRKTPLNWITLVFSDFNTPGNLVAMKDYQHLHTLPPNELLQFIRDEVEMWGGKAAHVIVGPGDWYSNMDDVKDKLSSLSQNPEATLSSGLLAKGIASVFAEDKPVFQVMTYSRPEATPLSHRPDVRLEQVHVVATSPDVEMQLREPDQPGYSPPDESSASTYAGQPPPMMADPMSSYIDLRLRREQGILGKLGALLPGTKALYRHMVGEIRSGYRVLEKLGEPARELFATANKRRDFVQRNQARHNIAARPILQSRGRFINSLHRQNPGESREYFRSVVDTALWDFTEGSVDMDVTLQRFGLRSNASTDKLGADFKELVRQFNMDEVTLMMQLKEDARAVGEEVSIWDSNNNRIPFRPFMPGWGWSATNGNFVKNGVPHTIEDAIKASDKLWMPHHYTKEHWNSVYEETESMLQMLNLGPLTPMPTALFTHDAVNDTWTNNRGQVFDERADAIQVEREFQLSRNRVASNYRDAMEAMAEGRLGRQGHVERARETDDQAYLRDIDLYMQVNDTFWERAGDIRYYGQFDPIFQGNPRLKAYLQELRNITVDAREEALRLFVSPLILENALSGNKLYPGIEHLDMRNPQIALRNWTDIDVDSMIAESRDPQNNLEPIDDTTLVNLESIGLLTRTATGYDFASETAKGKVLGEYLGAVKEREDAAYSIISGLSKWDRTPQEMSSDFWRRVSDVTTMMTLGIRASVQNIFEIPLLVSLTGSKAFLQATAALVKDPDLKRLGPILGATMRQTIDYLKDSEVQEKYLKWSAFSGTDQLSRTFGALTGWKAAENAIRSYIGNPTRAARVRLEQLRIDPTVIDNFRQQGGNTDLEAVFTEALQRTKDSLIMTAGVRPPDAPPPSNPFVDTLGDEMGKSASWISNVIFKEYDALSLPKLLRRQEPLLRVFLKYKSWQGQQHAYIMRALRHSRDEALQGNFEPAWHLGQSIAILGAGKAGLDFVMGFVTGRHEDKELWRRSAEGIANSGSLGTFSILLDAAMLAEGNPYRGVMMINSMLSNPTASIASDVVGRTITGDIGGAAWSFARHVPLIREGEQLLRGHYDDDATVRAKALDRITFERGFTRGF